MAMSTMVGVGRGPQVGVLIKNAEAMELFEKIDTLVIDKNGAVAQTHFALEVSYDGDPAGALGFVRLKIG